MQPVELSQFLPNNAFAALLVFARVGSAMMLLPGFGEVYVPQRFRLLLALLISAVLLPIVSPLLPALPSEPSQLLMTVGSEIAVGIFMGTMARMVLAALETAGQVVSMQMGLSNAVMFNPAAAAQDAIPAALYGMLGVLLIFLTNLHHVMLRALMDSYMVFAPGKLPPIEDLSQTMSHAVSNSFRLAIEMASPFIVLGTVFFVGLGLIARLVPQLQILFVTQPLQIMGGLVLFAVIMATGMGWFLDAFTAQFNMIIPG